MATRTGCYLCPCSYKDHRECQRHFRQHHPNEYEWFGFDYALTRKILVPPPSIPLVVTPPLPRSVAPSVAPAVAPLVRVPEPNTMEETSGRGHREKIPSAKVKEQATKLLEKVDASSQRNTILPYYVAMRDPRFENEQKEIQKIYDHTKIGPDGEKTDWYSLGAQ